MNDRVRAWLPSGSLGLALTIRGVAEGSTISLTVHLVVAAVVVAVVRGYQLRKARRVVAGALEPVDPPAPGRAREEESRRLADWCDGPEAASALAVAGPPGTGKSRLMRGFARGRGRKWRTGLLRPGQGRDLVPALRNIGGPTLILVEEADLREDVDGLLAELRGYQGTTTIRLLLEVRRPCGVEQVVRLPGPDGVRSVRDADPDPVVAAALLVGPLPTLLRRIPELAGRTAAEREWVAERAAGDPVRPVPVAGRLLAEVAAARPGLIDRLTRDVSVKQARRALWWLALIVDESPEAAESFLRLAASRPELLPRAVCCLVGDGLATPLAALVAAREWTPAERDAMDSPDLPDAVRSALRAAA
ncbi:hypothetical protein GT755_33985 [Herbidospora sp. NEAU-GS84]|uniref:Uncharacterized protein n=1 Tax=Herbidospora solisilvae TaxID=2696284 RepID=A0A7C9N1I8_9ACTN|nr:hypothetical protein [Herbidospora solisilvae]NAS26671.1 hypothetical protein [Herbidospora solisilvae]